MQTKTINIYTINELSEEAKEKAYYNWLQDFYYSWDKENTDTLNAFARIFPVEINRYEYDDSSSYIDFDMTCDDNIADLSGVRLLKYIYNNYYHDIFKGKFFSKSKWVDGKFTYKHRYSKVIKDNSCTLTGYCMDLEILNPIYKFLQKPKDNITFADLMENCLDCWVNACQHDYKYCSSLEGFIDEVGGGDYEYLEDGEVWTD